MRAPPMEPMPLLSGRRLRIPPPPPSDEWWVSTVCNRQRFLLLARRRRPANRLRTGVVASLLSLIFATASWGQGGASAASGQPIVQQSQADAPIGCSVRIAYAGKLDCRIISAHGIERLARTGERTVDLPEGLAEGDIISIRVQDNAGDGFCFVAQTADGTKVFLSGDAWRWTHNETHAWERAQSVAMPPWHPVQRVGEMPSAAGGNLPKPCVIRGKSIWGFYWARLKWTDVEGTPGKVPQIMAGPALMQVVAENYPIFYKGKMAPIGHIPKDEWRAARDLLEAALEDPNHGGVPGGEAAIRKMLRALYYASGPNTERKDALHWKVVCILAANVRVEWKDQLGSARMFRGQVEDPHQWRAWIEREMQRLSDIVFEKSLGKVNIVSEVLISRVPLTYLRQSGKRCWCTAAGAKPLIKDVLGNRRPMSIFVWIPTEGSGDFPPLLGASHVAPPEEDTRGAILTVAYTSRERMEKVGGWASSGGGGILHEFWHNVEQAVRASGFQGFIPSNHSEDHFNLLKAEYREQGFPQPQVRYDALLCSYPTWRMCKALSQKMQP